MGFLIVFLTAALVAALLTAQHLTRQVAALSETLRQREVKIKQLEDQLTESKWIGQEFDPPFSIPVPDKPTTYRVTPDGVYPIYE